MYNFKEDSRVAILYLFFSYIERFFMSYQIDFNNPCHVYFMGIGGVSMSGLAQILISKGFRVSGSDNAMSDITRHLESLGIKVFYGQKAENISLSKDIDLVVYTAAIHPGNPEFVAAKDASLPMITRAVLLGQVMKEYKLPIAVSGTHGKTTTTSMVSEILLAQDDDPTITVGGNLKAIGGNTRVGGDEFFVAEACEYTNSFLSFFPKIGIILDIDADHLDFFKDLDDIRNSFRKFAELLPKDGYLIINSDIPDVDKISGALKCKVITFGSSSSSDYYATDISYDSFANATFTAHRKGFDDLRISLKVPGEHNVYNALSAIATADLCRVSSNNIVKGLLAFTGTDRRFQYKGTTCGVNIIDDYAHHPTEIAATLNTAKSYPHNKIWCVFQPHTYTRTKALLPDFAKALCLADNIILCDIYAARETDTLGISSRTLQQEIIKNGHECFYFPSFDEAEKFLLKNCTKDDLLITMGAGDVYKIGDHLLGR